MDKSICGVWLDPRSLFASWTTMNEFMLSLVQLGKQQIVAIDECCQLVSECFRAMGHCSQLFGKAAMPSSCNVRTCSEV